MIKERFRRPVIHENSPALQPIFDDFHRLLMRGGSIEYPRHRHTTYELILVERGPYRCELNGIQLSVKPGEVLVIQPGDWHQDHLQNGQRHYVVHFRLQGPRKAEPVLLFRSGTTPELQVSRANHGSDAWLIEEIRRESEQGAAHAPSVQDCLLEALFWRTLRHLPAEGLSPAVRRLPADEAARLRIAERLHRHLRENLNLTAIAAELRMSPRHFGNQCRSLFGDPPARLFLRLKLEAAADFLRAPGVRIKEASDQFGFANPYHFSRVFRRHFGRTPSAFIEHLRHL